MTTRAVTLLTLPFLWFSRNVAQYKYFEHLVTHTSVSEMGHHLFRYRLVDYLTPSHDLITSVDSSSTGSSWTNFREISIKNKRLPSTRCMEMSVAKLRPFCRPPLQWRHNERDGVSNHQPHDCLLKRLFRRRSKTTSKVRVTGLCAGNSPGTSEVPAQMASYAENVSIWWRHHD